MSRTDLAKDIYEDNKAKGFWDNPRDETETFSLIASEIGELIECHRKDMRSDIDAFYKRLDEVRATVNTKIVDDVEEYMNQSFVSNFKRSIKDSFEDELADIAIRCYDYLGSTNEKIDLVESHINFSIDKEKEENRDFYHLCFNYLFQTLVYTGEETQKEQKIERAKDVLENCYIIAGIYDIDLDKHIESKLRYNRSRPYKHGKNS